MELAKTRHMVLCDFVVHQELVVYALQHGLPLPPLPAHPTTSSSSSSSGSSTHDSHNSQAPAAAAAAVLAAAGAGCSSSTPIAASYMADMLRRVSPEQLQQVRDWSGEEDVKKMTQTLFQQLVALLELIQRQDDEEEEQQQQQQQSDTAQDAPPDTAAAAAAAAAAFAAAGFPGGADSARRQLEHLVDDALTKCAVGMIFNCRVFVDSACNHQMHEGSAPVVEPQSHWKRVARRLKLTQEQLLLLRIAADEYSCMVQQEQREGRVLLQLAADYLPSTNLAIKAQQESAAAAAAAAVKEEDAAVAAAVKQEQGEQEAGAAASSCSTRSASSRLHR
ncbi:hypothetical protein OEZ85_014390 [Tetradesmus obliquus]|uniref:Uncharacterized protein n=1 Tax=Tetradesmus obliquus TaxID=3088 RepID=A0ABY8U7Y0_TETOB|nr:hypothetical protein OEZ85_014390 [Tetradesmus obliquus]